ncbi:uncharacterized protein LOC115755510 isoform X1 [Rhodamnia argentea]|uniref:Uncharacterized protein LOC115755510 isoform X1 n=1 Tax=Rhodamnia argentea TaxID=178133 RepID=A0ABM3H477_9MYRT|nr:uncharacterized protein LOC115755510 isoform X1 [Rhodamnia argentea]
MMNVVAICLVVTSLAAAGVLSPGPEKQSSDRKNDEVILKEGHRVVVVEYDRDGHANTKVSISPEHDHVPIKPASVSNLEGHLYQGAKDVLERSKDKVKEAASSVVPERKEDGGGRGYTGAKELICDALGKCKHGIASSLEKAKEEVTEKVHKVEEDARQAKDAAEEKLRRAGEMAREAAQEAGEKARETFESTRGAVQTAKEEGKMMAEDIRRNVSVAAGAAKERAKEKAEEAKEAATSVGSRLRRLGETARRHVASLFDRRTLAGLVHLLGFAMAYGTCAWVTFVSSYVLAGALPRQQFGMVQSKMYPVYFRAMFSSVALTLVGHLLGQGRQVFASKPEMLQGLNLLASLPLVLANMLYLEPRATKIMFERMKLEKEEGRGREHQGGAEATRATERRPPLPDDAAAPTQEDREGDALRSRVARLNERLRKLNSYSSLLNVATLMALTWHLVCLAQRISAPC